MEAGLIRNAARQVMLQYGLEVRPDTDGPFNLIVRDLALLRLVRSQISHLGLEEMNEALQDDAAFEAIAYRDEVLVNGLVSSGGWRFESRPVHRKASLAKRADYEALLSEMDAMPRPAIARFDTTNVTLAASERVLRLMNEGFGSDDDIEILGIDAPPWLEATAHGREVVLQSAIEAPGVYHGTVTTRTTAGDAQVVVDAERLDFALPRTAKVRLDSYLPDDGACDTEATRDRVVAFLSGLGYELLPGGVAVQLEPKPALPDRIRVRLNEAYVTLGEVPLSYRVEERPELFDADGVSCDAPVRYHKGFLTGLRDLFVDYEARADQALVLERVAEGYRFCVEDVDPLEEIRAFRYWVLGSASDLNALEDWRELLHRWIEDGEVNVLVHPWDDNAFTNALTKLHASGTVSVKRGGLMSFAPTVVAEGEHHVAIDLRRRRRTTFSSSLGFLWGRAQFLEGGDVREQAQSASEGEGLVLPLTPEQRKLAESLRPMEDPTGTSDEILDRVGILPPDALPPRRIHAEQVGTEHWWFTEPDRYTRLLRLSTDFRKQAGYAEREVAALQARELLESYDVTAEQVNTFVKGVRVTQGGWMLPAPDDLSLPKLARLVVDLVREPLHHSQLRQLCEAALGASIDSGTFLRASLDSCGWAGPGYRRSPVPGAPKANNLSAFVRELRDRGYLRKHEVLYAARRYVRTSPERLARVYDQVVSRQLAAGVAAD